MLCHRCSCYHDDFFDFVHHKRKTFQPEIYTFLTETKSVLFIFELETPNISSLHFVLSEDFVFHNLQQKSTSKKICVLGNAKKTSSDVWALNRHSIKNKKPSCCENQHSGSGVNKKTIKRHDSCLHLQMSGYAWRKQTKSWSGEGNVRQHGWRTFLKKTSN